MEQAAPTLEEGFRVGRFEVHPKRLTLVADGESVRLEPKVMAVLVYLAERAGDVVTRNEFAEHVWRGRVVSDEVLSRDISILRSNLGDNAKEPEYVMTVPRVGYRLIAPVAPLHAPPAELPADVASDNASLPDGARRNSASASQRLRYLVPLLLAVLGVALWLRYGPKPEPDHALDARNVAVLPFVNLSASADDEYFGDGLSEEIMHTLAGVDGIRVVARTSSFALRDSKDDVRDIGRKLNAGSILEGSVRRDGERLRITAQLVDANSGLHAWSESYDRSLSDIFDVQNEISTAIANRLLGTLAPGSRVGSEPTRDPRVYQLFLRANHALRRRGAEPLVRAVDLFEQTLELDPQFGRAYAGLAEAYTLQPSYLGTIEAEAHTLALAAADRAEALGAGEGRARGVRAFLNFRSRQWSQAKADFEAAIASSPEDSDLQQWYSQYLANVGWMRHSYDVAKGAVDGDPLSPAANQRLAVISLWMGDRDAATRHFALAEELGAGAPGLPEAYIAFLLLQTRVDEARDWLFSTQTMRGRDTSWIDPVFEAITHRGSVERALMVLDAGFRGGAFSARLYFGALFFMADVDALYGAMEQIVVSQDPFDVELFFSKEGRPLREDPRFANLMTEIGLVDFWRAEGWPDICDEPTSTLVCR